MFNAILELDPWDDGSTTSESQRFETATSETAILEATTSELGFSTALWNCGKCGMMPPPKCG